MKRSFILFSTVIAGVAAGIALARAAATTPATAPAGRLDKPCRPERSDRLAQRGPGDRQLLGKLALGRKHRPFRIDPEADGRGQLLDTCLEGVVAAYRSENHLRQRLCLQMCGHAVSLDSSRPGCQ